MKTSSNGTKIVVGIAAGLLTGGALASRRAPAPTRG